MSYGNVYGTERCRCLLLRVTPVYNRGTLHHNDLSQDKHKRLAMVKTKAIGLMKKTILQTIYSVLSRLCIAIRLLQHVTRPQKKQITKPPLGHLQATPPYVK